MNQSRREFIAGAACASLLAGGCRSMGAFGGAAPDGAPMRNFAVAPMSRIRVGVVGVGYRGIGAVRRLLKVPGIELTAICDTRKEFLDRAVAEAKTLSGRTPRAFGPGDEAYKALCDWDEVDVVYNTTSWEWHAPISLYAMRAGKHTFIEVPAAMRIDECWELVKTAEQTKRHCMQLENCCYGEYELLALNLCKLGLLGELLHGEGGYIHDRRWAIHFSEQWQHWRRRWNETHAGNQYPTHGLGPICLDMGINRGDKMDYIVSMDGNSRGYVSYAAEVLPQGDALRANRYDMADMNLSLIRTVNGRTIMLQHDVTSPRPYSRLNLIAGTKGVFRSYPRLGISIEGEAPRDPIRHAFDDKETERLREKYMHPLYKKSGELSRKMGGHGGMDFLMDLRWATSLLHGQPLDMDVYDMASWCAVCELSERSARDRSRPVDFPDFTDGAWKKPCECNLMNAC